MGEKYIMKIYFGHSREVNYEKELYEYIRNDKVLSKENIISEIETRVKESFREINLRAFEKGEQIGAKYEIK